jgi:hypothetical protein
MELLFGPLFSLEFPLSGAFNRPQALSEPPFDRLRAVSEVERRPQGSGGVFNLSF